MSKYHLVDTIQSTIQSFRPRREALGWSQERLAHAAGITLAAYAAIERGRSDPRSRTIDAITTALNEGENQGNPAA